MSFKRRFSVQEVARLVKQGEGSSMEFKRSTGELKEAMQTLCAFLNGAGGTVLVGVRPNGTIEGQLLEEAEMFCRRHFPLPGRIVPGKLQREDKPLIPPDAMREILVNALIHRDYSIAGGAISLAIFEDRVEVWSAGRFPTGITPAMLSREHDSVPRNPIIAEVFHRAGLIEKWGRGTNRVIAMCRAAGIRPPEFAEVGPSAVVTFRVPVAGSGTASGQVEAPVEAPVSLYVTDRTILNVLGTQECGKSALLKQLGHAQRSGNFKKAIEELLMAQMIERTIPDKPNSRLQKYRLTAKGKAILEKPA
jgi:ATP-dependent DNA helicase RecG